MLFGQLGFCAIAFYGGVTHPSWPLWMLMGVGCLCYGARMRLGMFEALLFLFFAWVLVNYLVRGNGTLRDIFVPVMVVTLLPYVFGKLFGQFFRAAHLLLLVGIAFGYIFVVGFEVVFNPEVVFGGERLVLFKSHVLDPQYTIGLAAPTFISNLLGPISVLLVYCFVFNRGFSRWIKSHLKGMYFPALLGFPMVLFVCGSRSSLISLLMGVGLLALFERKLNRKTLLRVGGLLAVVVFIAQHLSSARLSFFGQLFKVFDLELLSSITALDVQGDSILIRMAHLYNSVVLFLQSPIAGVGPGNYGLNYFGHQVLFEHPHSVPFQIAAELGGIGLMLWAMLIGYIFYLVASFQKNVEIPVEKKVLAMALFSFWVYFLINDLFVGTVYNSLHFFSVTGILVAFVKGMKRTYFRDDLNPNSPA